MPDQLIIEKGTVRATTEEGLVLERDETALHDMFRAEYALPLGDAALPDGVKFVEWRSPFLVVVHQTPPHVRRLQWIADDSPRQFGPGTRYHPVRLSLPYVITFAVYYQHRHGLSLTASNELYFRNEPLGSRRDRVGFPALLNVSAIETPARTRAWICTQYLRQPIAADWTAQLDQLLDHTFNGGFNRSSEHHEGASWYGASRGVDRSLHPIQKWEQATAADERFGLRVAWKPAPLCVQELIEALLAECQQSAETQSPPAASGRTVTLVHRFVNFAQTPGKKAS